MSALFQLFGSRKRPSISLEQPESKNSKESCPPSPKKDLPSPSIPLPSDPAGPSLLPAASTTSASPVSQGFQLMNEFLDNSLNPSTIHEYQVSITLI